MSRFDGWLVRFIMMHGTPARVSVREAAKGACVRPDTFHKALSNRALVEQDARHLGFDPAEMRAIHEWLASLRSDADVEASMVASAAARTTPKPSSEKYKGSRTRLGAWRPNPASAHRDALNIPINRIEHPEPQGEWHDGLAEAGHARR